MLVNFYLIDGTIHNFIDVLSINIYNLKFTIGVLFRKKALEIIYIARFCCLFDRQYCFRYGGRIHNEKRLFFA